MSYELRGIVLAMWDIIETRKTSLPRGDHEAVTAWQQSMVCDKAIGPNITMTDTFVDVYLRKGHKSCLTKIQIQ